MFARCRARVSIRATGSAPQRGYRRCVDERRIFLPITHISRRPFGLKSSRPLFVPAAGFDSGLQMVSEEENGP